MKKNRLYLLRQLLIPIFTLLIMSGLCPLAFGGESQALPHSYRESGPARPNGQIIIQVRDGANWADAGSIPFDKYLRASSIELDDIIPAGTRDIKIRLMKKGGGSAHLDSILLGGSAPSAVDGDDGFLRSKLSQKDLDVINIDENGVEIDFNSGAGDGELTVAARIEELLISKIPFQFPSKNNYHTITGDSTFYIYRLDSRRGSITKDGSIEEVCSSEPFFKEYVHPGSGHPPGYTYGWVFNDDNNLYVAMDFTPDNTMDGDKDYAKVYVSTPKGIKEFRVSVPDTAWGKPGFTYTDKVPYQHKVYEFAIPLNALGIESCDEHAEVPLAFSAYGTASLPVISTDPADESVDVPVNKTITIEFGYDAIPGPEINNITLNGSVVGYVYSIDPIDPTKLTVDFTDNLEYGTDYTVELPSGTVIGSSNSAYSVYHAFSFRTEPVEYVLQWGESCFVPEDGKFISNNLYGVAVDNNGHVYIADNKNRIQKFNDSGVFEESLLATNKETWLTTHYLRGVAVDSAGNVFATDGDADNIGIQVFSTAGDVTRWGVNGPDEGEFMPGLYGVAVADGHIYVVDQQQNRVQRFTAAGAFELKWGAPGAGDGEFNNPLGIAVDGYGFVFVVDSGNNRIQKFDADGDYIDQWGVSGSGDDEFDQPTYIAIDQIGNVFVSDTNNNRIQKFDGGGNYLTQWGSAGNGDGEFNKPRGIAVDNNGFAYVADALNNRIQKFRIRSSNLDDENPMWMETCYLNASAGATSITLSWDPATDNTEVTDYKIYQDGIEIGTVDGDTTTYTVNGLSPDTGYTFKVEAGDAAGNWSDDGLSVTVTTAGGAVSQAFSKSPEGGSYTVTIPAGAVNSADGLPLAEDYTFTFTVQGPEEQ